MLNITKASTGVVAVLVTSTTLMLLVFGVIGLPVRAVQATLRIIAAAIKVVLQAFIMWVPALSFAH
jgi:hypothetical protein